MSKRTGIVTAIVLGTALAMAGCSSTSGSPSTSTTTSSASTPASTSSSSSVPRSSTTTTTGPASNVPVTDQIRSQLVAAAAALNSVPASQYTGLAPGLTYYALDNQTNIYWAGARLVPAPSADPSQPTGAQVSSQDAGSYYVFYQPLSGGPWTVYAAGNEGPGTSCPVTIPAAVLQVWGWPAGSCRPSGV
jgi:hypothetical protein